MTWCCYDLVLGCYNRDFKFTSPAFYRKILLNFALITFTQCPIAMLCYMATENTHICTQTVYRNTWTSIQAYIQIYTNMCRTHTCTHKTHIYGHICRCTHKTNKTDHLNILIKWNMYMCIYVYIYLQDKEDLITLIEDIRAYEIKNTTITVVTNLKIWSKCITS
jgi:hypothetical protein